MLDFELLRQWGRLGFDHLPTVFMPSLVPCHSRDTRKVVNVDRHVEKVRRYGWHPERGLRCCNLGSSG